MNMGKSGRVGGVGSRAVEIERLEPRRLFSATFNLSFVDDGSHAAYYNAIRSNMLAAANEWGTHFTSDATLDIEVHFSPNTLRASGRSFVTHIVGMVGSNYLVQDGAGYELRTGQDPNGAAPDIEIFFQDDYLNNELWFDPDPTTRTATVPTNRTDAYSVCLHELGHAFGFNGFRNGTDGALPDRFESTWDQYVVFDGTNLYFTGPNARATFGFDVPLTYGLPNHIGNNQPRPGQTLIPDLMNGVVFYRGRRYQISNLDLAILQDVGDPVKSSATAVSNRRLFYNDSAFDGQNSAITPQDLAAVAVDKQAVRPGAAASFAAVSAYSKGINGLLIDFAGTPPATLVASDFTFRVGTTGSPSTWPLAAAPTAIFSAPTPPGADVARYFITWADGAIKNTWLQVTVKANAHTGLAKSDVFYFGSLIGETGGSSTLAVEAADLVRTRNAIGPASVAPTSPFDFNRDGAVNAADLVQVRNNVGRVLPLFTATAVTPGEHSAFLSIASPLQDRMDDSAGMIEAVDLSLVSSNRRKRSEETPAAQA